MKLNLCCGDVYKEGYINIDKYGAGRFKVDRDFDCSLPIDYPDNSIDEIMIIHGIEHLDRVRLKVAVRSWWRVLKPGGKLIIETPNLLTVFKEYIDRVLDANISADPNEILEWVYGNNDRPGQIHYWGWSPPMMRGFLLNVGFSKVEDMKAKDDTRPQELSFRVEATK